MLFIEHKPAAPLDRTVRMLWYSSTTAMDHRRERILPTGCTQVILNLARDFLLECPQDGSTRRSPAAQVVGARSIYEIINTSDLACLIGIVFRPGGFPAFAADRADLFTNRFFDLEDIWGSWARDLRDRLRALTTPQARLACLEGFLALRLKEGRTQSPSQHALVHFALSRFGQAQASVSVRQVARDAGWSERRLSQVFREQVGLTPKVWCRIQRFQRAVRRLHEGADTSWTDLALDCGFYDQSHFANEFRAFSGIDATTYVTGRGTPWANHVQAE